MRLVQTSVFFFADDPRCNFARLDGHRFVNDARALGVVAHFDMTRDGEVFAERMTNETVIGEDAAQILVTFKHDAVQIEGFALVLVG